MRAGTIGLALCVLAGLCMVAGLAVDIDSTAAKLFILASAVLFVPGGSSRSSGCASALARRREGGARRARDALLLAQAAGAAGPVVVIDPGHDARANSETADRARLGDPEDQGRRRDARRRHRDTRGRSRPGHLAAAARIAPSSGCRGRDDQDADGRAEHGEHRARPDANRAGAALFLSASTPTVIRVDGLRHAHVVPALRGGWTDDVHRSSRRAAARPAGARPRAGL